MKNLIKICKSCGAENDTDLISCAICMSDISGIEPSEKISEETKILTFVIGDINLIIDKTCIIGREAEGAEIFAKYPTISRQHAKIEIDEDRFYISDYNSSNGVFVNNIRIDKEKVEIKNGDKIKLSRALEIMCKV